MKTGRDNVLRLAQEVEFRGTCVHGDTADDECDCCTEVARGLDDEGEDILDRLERADNDAVERWLVAIELHEQGRLYDDDELRTLATQPCA